MWSNIKRDFNSVKDALDYIAKRPIPMWMAILYYVLMVPIGLLMYPIGRLWTKWTLWLLRRNLSKY